jgi:uncharacterized protein (TIGR03067 family)
MLAVAVAALVGFAPAPFPNPDKGNDLEKMQGKWVLVYHEECGTVTKLDEEVVLEITGKHLTVLVAGQVEKQFLLRLHPNKTVPSVDLKTKDSELYLCIFRLKGDRLTICAGGKARPSNFRLGLENGFVVILKRRKPE